MQTLIMEYSSELEMLKKQLETVKQEKNQRLLSYDPLSFGFFFGVGFILALTIATLIASFLLLLLGFGVLSTFLS